MKNWKNTIEAQEKRLAVIMLAPSLFIVLSIVLFPVILNFWVSFKPVRLGDLRPPAPIVRERLREEGGILYLRYQIRNSNPDKPIEFMTLRDSYPNTLEPTNVPPEFHLSDGSISLELENLEGGYLNNFEITFRMNGSGGSALEDRLLNTVPVVTARADNVLTNFRFTLNNYKTALGMRELGKIMLTTILYAFLGSGGALLCGLFAALLVNRDFPGSGAVRGIFLFPYVAPIVAVAFIWRFLFDAQSGTINGLLQTFSLIREPISFLSTEPNALVSSIFFDAWRYFPFCYLFILARLKAIPNVLYESAEIEGAGNFTAFWHITLPQIREVLLSVFILRFIWTFNRFDDIFLLTGGAAGTRTLPIQVYEYALGAGNIGGGAAFSVVLFVLLTLFLLLFLTTSREVDS